MEGTALADKSKSLKSPKKASKGQGRRDGAEGKRRRGAFPKANRNADTFAFSTLVDHPKSVQKASVGRERDPL